MLFNSIDFALFLPIVFALYWFVFNRSLKAQNALLVVASYIFYGWWDWRFLSLIAFSSLVDYVVGLGLARTEAPQRRKALLAVSILVNLGFLGFFKYFNFFSQSFADAFTFLGQPFEPLRLNIILPVGISFYTFQTLSYSIDVYRRQMPPNKNLMEFLAFVSFFPQLVAGPIERASNLLPQFSSKRQFDLVAASDGMRQILWGLFKKIVIADNCAEYANLVFNNSSDYSGNTLLLGAFFFAFQIYGDFSGYSDIAIGTARLFGFNLMQNFAFPYFSRDIAEFWRRWHISLSTWFRDYLYIPLGGSRGGRMQHIRNVFIIFVVSGFWHGANWTFIAWGAVNALYFLPLLLTDHNRAHLDTAGRGRLLPHWREALMMLITFILTLFAWIFFRAENITHAFEIIGNIFSADLASVPFLLEQGTGRHFLPKTVLLIIFLFLIVEWFGRENQYAIEKTGLNWPRVVRYSLYCLIVFAIFRFGGKAADFIYFQF